MVKRRKRWSRILFPLLLIAVVILAIPLTGGAQEQVTIGYTMFGSPEGGHEWEAIEMVVEKFEQNYPNIKIDLDFGGWTGYKDRVLTQMAAGIPMDIVVVDAYDAQGFYEKGVFLNLEPYIERDKFPLDLYIPEAINEKRGYTDGKLYGLEFDYGTGIWVCWWNKDIFKEAGLDPPTSDWTRDDFLEIVKKTTKVDKEGKIIQWGVVGVANPFEAYWAPWLFSGGGSILNDERTKCLLDEPEAIETFQFLVDLAVKYEVEPSASAVEESGAGWSGYMFTNGKVALMFTWGSHGSHRQFIGDRFDWGALPVPKGEAGRISLIKGNSLSIAASSKNPDACWEYLKWSHSPEMQLLLAREGNMATLKSVREDPEFIYFDEPPYDMSVESKQELRAFPFIPKWNEIAAVWRNKLVPVFTGEKSVTNGLSEIAVEIDRILAEK